jgi:hypothetical protein
VYSFKENRERNAGFSDCNNCAPIREDISSRGGESVSKTAVFVIPRISLALAAAVMAFPVGTRVEFPGVLAVAAPRKETQAGIPAAQGVAVLQEDARTVPPLEDEAVAAES